MQLGNFPVAAALPLVKYTKYKAAAPLLAELIKANPALAELTVDGLLAMPTGDLLALVMPIADVVLSNGPSKVDLACTCPECGAGFVASIDN